MVFKPGITAAAAILLTCLPPAMSAVAQDNASYHSGTVHRDLLRGDFPTNKEVKGRISTKSESEFVFDAGRKGAIAVPYSEILSLTYGPLPWDLPPELPRASPANLRYVPRDPRRYRWSGVAHPKRAREYLRLSLGEPESGHKLGVVFFELGREIVRPTLEALERHTGLATEFPTVEACLLGRSGDECGYGDPQLLKGKTTVFLDISGSDRGGLTAPDPERVARASQQHILSAIDNARLGLKVLTDREDASVIVNFHYHEGGCVNLGPLNPANTDCDSDRAVGEVYVVDSNGLTVVMLFDEERRPWKTRLATRFANAFIQTYKKANATK